MNIKCCYQNFLENAVVSLDQGAENSAFPLYRIYDRDIGLLFKGSAAATTRILAAGSAGSPVDRLLVPPGHNLQLASYLLLEGSNDSFAADTLTVLDTRNKLLSPNDFSTADWTKTGGTTATADLITFGGTGLAYQVYQGWTPIVGESHIFSVELKAKNTSAVVNIRGDRGTSSPGLNCAVTGAWQTFKVQCDMTAGGATLYECLLLVSGDTEIYARNASLSIGMADDGPVTTGLTNKTFTSADKASWRLTIGSPSAAPQTAELVLCPTYTWERNPRYPVGPSEDVFNVEDEVTSGGQDRFLVHGPAKKQRNYDVRCLAAQETNFRALYNSYAGSKPFFLQDVDGEWIYGKLTQRPEIRRISNSGTFTFKFNFLEVIA